MSTTSYLTDRYKAGLAKKLASLPVNLSAQEKQEILRTSLAAMAAQDRKAFEQDVLKEIIGIRFKKLSAIERRFKHSEANQVAAILASLQAPTENSLQPPTPSHA